MQRLFYLLGAIAFAIYIWTEFKRWREKRWVRESLKPFAGLDHGSDHRHVTYRRLIWCAVVLGFALTIALLMLTH